MSTAFTRRHFTGLLAASGVGALGPAHRGRKGSDRSHPTRSHLAAQRLPGNHRPLPDGRRDDRREPDQPGRRRARPSARTRPARRQGGAGGRRRRLEGPRRLRREPDVRRAVERRCASHRADAAGRQRGAGAVGGLGQRTDARPVQPQPVPDLRPGLHAPARAGQARAPPTIRPSPPGPPSIRRPRSGPRTGTRSSTA